MDELENVIGTLDAMKLKLLSDPYFDEGCFEMSAWLELQQAIALIDAAATGLRKARLLQTRSLAQTPRY